MTGKGNTRCDQSFIQIPTGRNANTAVMQPCPTAFFSPKTFVGNRLIDQGLGDFTRAIGTRFFNRNRNSKMRNCMKKVRGAIQGINNPTRFGRITWDSASFFTQETPIGAGMFQDFINGVLRPLISDRNEISGAFTADLQMLNFTEITSQKRAALRAARSIIEIRPGAAISLPASHILGCSHQR
uniref:Uncharacterized protein n=1 Tax=Zymomonas mobilis TaxID=542 RepID=Q9RNK0_ZYMMB|nr:hypothetical protein; zm12orf9 [Zymomonas mobilis subsp. mobilis ZM4 = ATCC 31821]